MEPDELTIAHFDAMATGDAELARRCIDAEHINRMAADEPPACALPGLPGFLATSAWLRLAFTDLRFEPIDIVTQDERTIAHVWMHARQTGPFVVFPPGQKPQAFPPTGREFAVRQCHVFRHAGGRHREHIAVRDDLGMMTQLGHLPPTPMVAARLALYTVRGHARHAIAQAVAVAEAASRTVTQPLAA